MTTTHGAPFTMKQTLAAVSLRPTRPIDWFALTLFTVSFVVLTASIFAGHRKPQVNAPAFEQEQSVAVTVHR